MSEPYLYIADKFHLPPLPLNEYTEKQAGWPANRYLERWLILDVVNHSIVASVRTKSNALQAIAMIVEKFPTLEAMVDGRDGARFIREFIEPEFKHA